MDRRTTDKRFRKNAIFRLRAITSGHMTLVKSWKTELELKGPESLVYSIPKFPEPYSFHLYNKYNNILPICQNCSDNKMKLCIGKPL